MHHHTPHPRATEAYGSGGSSGGAETLSIRAGMSAAAESGRFTFGRFRSSNTCRWCMEDLRQLQGDEKRLDLIPLLRDAGCRGT